MRDVLQLGSRAIADPTTARVRHRQLQAGFPILPNAVGELGHELNALIRPSGECCRTACRIGVNLDGVFTGGRVGDEEA